MLSARPELDDNPDRLRWNAKYGSGFVASFEPHPLAVEALALLAVAGRVLELACGPSGNALRAAATGHRVVAVDASDVALRLLAKEADRRGLSGLLTLVHADLKTWRPEPERYSLVLSTGYWDADLFQPAVRAVEPGGLLAWEACTEQARQERPSFPAAWCLAADQPASLLPPGWQVLGQNDVPGTRRRLLARASLDVPTAE